MALPLVNVDAAPFRAKPIESALDRVERARVSRAGVRSKGVAQGHCIGSTSNPASGELHIVDTVVAHVEQGLPLQGGMSEEGLRYRKIAGRGRRNILFIVDTSGSMLPSDRLAQVKGCVISLLEDAYVKRTRVALVSCGGARARLALPFTSSPELAAKRIDAMLGGGGTPFVEALTIAAGLIDRLDGEPAEVVVLSDGRYNRSSHASAQRRIRAFGAFCKRNRVPIHLVNAGAQKKTSAKRAAHMAEMLQADRRTLDDLRADAPLSR